MCGEWGGGVRGDHGVAAPQSLCVPKGALATHNGVCVWQETGERNAKSKPRRRPYQSLAGVTCVLPLGFHLPRHRSSLAVRTVSGVESQFRMIGLAWDSRVRPGLIHFRRTPALCPSLFF